MSETIPVRFDILYEYADKHRLSYNELCKTVRDAIATGSADSAERIHRLEEAVAGLMILVTEWEPDHASPEDLDKIRRARRAIGEPQLTAQLKAIGRLT